MAQPPQKLSLLRSLPIGIFIGTLLNFSNTYFGLQTGWVTMASLQSALLAFGIAKVAKWKMSVEENVFIQTVAVAVGTMPLAAGFVGVIPALTMITPAEGGAPSLNTGHLLLWTFAVAFFGVFIAVPLRKHFIIKNPLPFPSGTATAHLIRLLHTPKLERTDSEEELIDTVHDRPREQEKISTPMSSNRSSFVDSLPHTHEPIPTGVASGDLRQKFIMLGFSFALSGGHTLLAYFIPVLGNLPIGTWIGLDILTQWYWFLTPSLSYVGQGMIMGPHASLSMFVGAIVGWGILGPVARHQGWAPGAIGDWKSGAKGWILWVSLAIMLSEALSDIAHLLTRALFKNIKTWRSSRRGFTWRAFRLIFINDHTDEEVLPEGHNIPDWVVYSGLALSTALCVGIVSPIFAVKWYVVLISIIFACLVSVMAVRSLGEIDMNPVSGIGKVSQLLFAAISPGQILPNILAGAMSEAGAQQAGDLMQDLKTGHLLGCSPRSQFIGQLFGSFASVFVTVASYKLYTTAYVIGSPQLEAPTAHVWIDMARIVTGGQLPSKVWEVALPFAIIFGLLPWIRPQLPLHITKYIPSGIAFAIGMYIQPNWVIPRVLGGVLAWFWKRRYQTSWDQGDGIIWASGFVLGEGIFSIITSILRVTHVNPWTCAGLAQTQHQLCETF